MGALYIYIHISLNLSAHHLSHIHLSILLWEVLQVNAQELARYFQRGLESLAGREDDFNPFHEVGKDVWPSLSHFHPSAFPYGAQT